ncbi:molybdenum cofactor guanylyltransferase [Leptospira jelokensis]|uniref:Probable molybdenum cofactor guanylyltransferase n=1 Tax=Leptospira jelokensis TaxID=2484931 RepID=A0A4Z0ZYA7_9LEPT|nr:molybdenum cofactor guanylyltransferase [Leptospira jelokensis]TGL75967.1 molybdenum cofactor guanylyltransferase [Leptospira jelokensis]
MKHTKNDLIFLLLAGGQSVRMGKEKAFLPIGKNSNFITKLIQKIKFFKKEVYLSLRSEQTKDYISFFPEDKIITDQNIPVFGPLLGLFSAHVLLKNSKHHYNALFVLPVDIPYIKLKTINRLINLYEKKPNASGFFYQSSTGLEPLCGIYHHQTLDKWLKDFETQIDSELSLQKKITNLEPKPDFILLPKVEERYFQNINTEKDLEFFKK